MSKGDQKKLRKTMANQSSGGDVSTPEIDALVDAPHITLPPPDKLLAVANLDMITKDLEWVRHALLVTDLMHATSGVNPRLKVRYADGREVGVNAMRDHVSEQKGEPRYLLSRELGAWLQEEGWAVQYNGRPARLPGNDLPKRGIQDAQETEILRIIKEVLNLDPMQLAKSAQGHSGSRAAVKVHITFDSGSPFKNENTFNLAWRRLLGKGKIGFSDANANPTGV